MFLKLVNLYTALTSLYAKFPGVRSDAVALYNLIETIVVERAWSWSSMSAALLAAEVLVKDFAASWDGGAEALAAFEDSLKALFN